MLESSRRAAADTQRTCYGALRTRLIMAA